MRKTIIVAIAVIMVTSCQQQQSAKEKEIYDRWNNEYTDADRETACVAYRYLGEHDMWEELGDVEGTEITIKLLRENCLGGK